MGFYTLNVRPGIKEYIFTAGSSGTISIPYGYRKIKFFMMGGGGSGGTPSSSYGGGGGGSGAVVGGIIPIMNGMINIHYSVGQGGPAQPDGVGSPGESTNITINWNPNICNVYGNACQLVISAGGGNNGGSPSSSAPGNGGSPGTYSFGPASFSTWYLTRITLLNGNPGSAGTSSAGGSPGTVPSTFQQVLQGLFRNYAQILAILNSVSVGAVNIYNLNNFGNGGAGGPPNGGAYDGQGGILILVLE